MIVIEKTAAEAMFPTAIPSGVGAFALYAPEYGTVLPGTTVHVDLGVTLHLPEGVLALLGPIAGKGGTAPKASPKIDEGRASLVVKFKNRTERVWDYREGSRIAQLTIIVPPESAVKGRPEVAFTTALPNGVQRTTLAPRPGKATVRELAEALFAAEIRMRAFR